MSCNPPDLHTIVAFDDSLSYLTIQLVDCLITTPLKPNCKNKSSVTHVEKVNYTIRASIIRNADEWMSSFGGIINPASCCAVAHAPAEVTSMKEAFPKDVVPPEGR